MRTSITPPYNTDGMPSNSGARPLLARIITVTGGLAFLGSGLWTVVVYIRDFGADPGPWASGAAWPAIWQNSAWFVLFATHHSVFARDTVKTWMAAFVSTELERSTYVWIASALLAALVWHWRPVPGIAWAAPGVAAGGLTALQLAGLAITGYAASQLGVLRLAGLRPPEASPRLRHDSLYGVVRHPIYFAWLLMVWPSPTMTGSRLTFAVLTTLYLVVAIPLEERSLRKAFGPAYDRYCVRVRWRMLPGVY